MPIDQNLIEKTLAAAKKRLLDERVQAGHWEGKLSTSALSTATSVCALALVRRSNLQSDQEDNDNLLALIRGGLHWLIQHQNEDGGWGDTISSPSNISTTVLVWAAMHFSDQDELNIDATSANIAAESWIKNRAGGLTAPAIGLAIDAVYGKDKTFSVPILTMCALSGRFGTGRDAWAHVKQLPFELAACPHQLFKWIGLPVVSYALPALIAIGQARHFHRPTRKPITRFLRAVTRKKTLRVLEQIQPASGGFLEAAPLTGFVLMSLASIGRANSKTAIAATRFLTETVRPDGSWPIDTNLATWVTTLSVGALDADGSLASVVPKSEQEALLNYILDQQYTVEHPYTHAAPGGWAWTHLTGGVPDADDTAGALLAIHSLFRTRSFDKAIEERIVVAAEAGVRWLIDLQNRDGGIPTFCRGWGKLPFDQSSPDLTAHALRAWNCWHDALSKSTQTSIARAAPRAVEFLLRTQRPDGSWIPLWFGNQQTIDQSNPLYGTSRVVRASSLESIRLLGGDIRDRWTSACARGQRWIIDAQNKDGGWGGAAGAPSSIEETALAIEALAEASALPAATIDRGIQYLATRTHGGTVFDPSPIGLYFAKLWYCEKLYPLIFTVSALNRVATH